MFPILTRIPKRLPSRRRPAFTLVELLVVIAIIAILIAILLPALKKARDQSMKVQCGSNIRQVALAILNYTQDWNGTIPYNYAPAPPAVSAMWRGRLTGQFFLSSPLWTNITGGVVYLRDDSDAWLCPFVVRNNYFSPMYFETIDELRWCYGMNTKLRIWYVPVPLQQTNPPTIPVYPVKITSVKSKIPLLADGHPYNAGGKWLWTDWNTCLFDDTWRSPRGPWNCLAPWPINRPDVQLPATQQPGPVYGVVTTLHGGSFSAAFPDGHVEQLKNTTPEMFQYP